MNPLFGLDGVQRRNVSLFSDNVGSVFIGEKMLTCMTVTAATNML